MERLGIIELMDEIYLEDAYKIADWLENEEITQFLSEGKDISHEIRQALRYYTCPIVTHLFASNGNFYMIKLNGRSIGYLKLIPKPIGCEIVIVIGEKSMWNKGFGTKALNRALKEAFFEYRYEAVSAKIMFQNKASKHIFEKEGFNFLKKGNTCDILQIKLEEYLKKAA